MKIRRFISLFASAILSLLALSSCTRVGQSDEALLEGWWRLEGYSYQYPDGKTDNIETSDSNIYALFSDGHIYLNEYKSGKWVSTDEGVFSVVEDEIVTKSQLEFRIEALSSSNLDVWFRNTEYSTGTSYITIKHLCKVEGPEVF